MAELVFIKLTAINNFYDHSIFLLSLLNHKNIRTVLDERTGSFYDAGHRWEVCVGRHNKSAYTILNPFSTVEGNR